MVNPYDGAKQEFDPAGIGPEAAVVQDRQIRHQSHHRSQRQQDSSFRHLYDIVGWVTRSAAWDFLG